MRIAAADNRVSLETYLLKWEGAKDANEGFLKTAKDVAAFRELVEQRRIAAKAEPIPHVHSLQESMLLSDRTDLANAPQRLRFPWKPVDEMAILLPGSVMSIWATKNRRGKPPRDACSASTARRGR
ncbi:MAG TPA: hypothetical protein VG206_04730 [Terriglobia bacterium]|nr:hypothetical protein [Terriglobia bacterium]